MSMRRIDEIERDEKREIDTMRRLETDKRHLEDEQKKLTRELEDIEKKLKIVEYDIKKSEHTGDDLAHEKKEAERREGK